MDLVDIMEVKAVDMEEHPAEEMEAKEVKDRLLPQVVQEVHQGHQPQQGVQVEVARHQDHHQPSKEAKHNGELIEILSHGMKGTGPSTARLVVSWRNTLSMETSPIGVIGALWFVTTCSHAIRDTDESSSRLNWKGRPSPLRDWPELTSMA